MDHLCDANVISCSPSTLHISEVEAWGGRPHANVSFELTAVAHHHLDPACVWGRGRPLACHTSCLHGESFVFFLFKSRTVFISCSYVSVRTHPRLVEAAVLAAHAEGFDGWRRLLCHQQSLLQLNLLLQLHQHRRLHAVPEKHSRVYTCLHLKLPLTHLKLLLLLCSKTYLETMRPISSRQRQTCRGSLCNTEAENTTINRLFVNNLKQQLPLPLCLERGWQRKRDEVRQHARVAFKNVTL